MSSIMQQKRNTTAGSPPAAAALAEGELGVNVADGLLWTGGTGGTGAPVTVANPTKQVYLDSIYDGGGGNLPLIGSAVNLKFFASGALGFEASPGGAIYPFPAVDGVAGQVMALNAGGTAFEFVAQAAAVNQFYTIPVGAGGDLWEDFNEVDWTGTNNQGQTTLTAFEANAGETIYLTFDRDATTYIFAAMVGTEYGLGGTLLTDNSLFIGLGGATPFATQADYNAGTAGVAVDPAVGNNNYLTKSAAGAGGAFQNVNSDVGFQGDFVVATSGGTRSEINRDTSFGAAGTPVTLTAANGTMQGLDAANPLTIDNAVIDGGTF